MENFLKMACIVTKIQNARIYSIKLTIDEELTRELLRVSRIVLDLEGIYQ